MGRRSKPEGLTLDDVLGHLRPIALDLPEVSERISHGAPTFFIREKRVLVTVWDDHHGDGIMGLCCPAPPGAQAELVEQEPDRFFVPKYVGHRGWVGLRLDVDPDWEEIRALVEEAFRLVAPRKLVAELEAELEARADDQVP